MFWIHGGSNIWGSGDFYDFSKLATTQQVIVITINYRLGLFGWFSSSILEIQLQALINLQILDI